MKMQTSLVTRRVKEDPYVWSFLWHGRGSKTFYATGILRFDHSSPSGYKKFQTPEWVSGIFGTIVLLGLEEIVSVCDGFLVPKDTNSTKFIFYRS